MAGTVGTHPETSELQVGIEVQTRQAPDESARLAPVKSNR